MSELRYADITVRFGRGRRALVAVDGVSLVVRSGQVLGLVGESGCGKSTLAAAAVGITPIDRGQILLDDLDVTRARGKQRRERLRIQLVFQNPFSSLDPRMTIGNSIAEAMHASRPAIRQLMMTRRRNRVRNIQAEVHTLLELVHLEPRHATVRPKQLSGGMLQRVALARALAAQPDIIIADEITSSLDVSVQGSILNLLRELQARLDLGVLFISHNLAVVRYVSDDIAVMKDGRIIEQQPAAQLIANPLEETTRQLLAAVPSLGRPQSTSPDQQARLPDAASRDIGHTPMATEAARD